MCCKWVSLGQLGSVSSEGNSQVLVTDKLGSMRGSVCISFL